MEGRPSECFSSPIPEEALRRFKAQTGQSKFNTVWEGIALLVAFRIWLPSLGYGAHVRAKSDNIGVLYMVANGKASSSELNILAREFSLDQALRIYRVSWLGHIPGITNLEADSLSRQFSPSPPPWPSALVDAIVRPVGMRPDFWREKDL